MPPSKERTTIEVREERAVLAGVRLPGSVYDPGDPFGELAALAEQAGAVVVGEIEQHRHRPVAGTCMGRGKLEELRELCRHTGASVVIFDHDLSPAQIANIERIVEVKVIDRSELILDIFASRATTRQARLQVELAQLEYTYPRLRAMWSHLERIVGSGAIGGVGTRGPGEQQLEIDRRLVQRRKQQLLRELRAIQARKKREVARRKQDHFTVALVGYTNAGKSTLFNTLTAPGGPGDAYADDRVFATLHTRTRAWEVAPGTTVMLSDTVGFVRDLPHHLIASFRATLEEVTHADLLLVVLDISDPSCELHERTIETTLREVFEDASRGAGHAVEQPARIVCLNKVDRLADAREILVWKSRIPDAVALCALSPAAGGSGRGLDELSHLVSAYAGGPPCEVEICVPLADARTIHEIEALGEQIAREFDAQHARYRVRIRSRHLERLRARAPSMRVRLLAESEDSAGSSGRGFPEIS